MNTLNDVKVPDKENIYNFLFDTTVFNRLAEHEDWLILLEKSLRLGFQYYKTVSQDYELDGRGAKTYPENISSKKTFSKDFIEKMKQFDIIKERLQIQCVSSCATLMHNHFILDGTMRLPDDNAEETHMVKSILGFNEKLRKKHPFAQYYDMLTAEAAIVNKCVLVSDDTDLRNLVNEDFPAQAISTQELITLIRSRIEL